MMNTKPHIRTTMLDIKKPIPITISGRVKLFSRRIDQKIYDTPEDLYKLTPNIREARRAIDWLERFIEWRKSENSEGMR